MAKLQQLSPAQIPQTLIGPIKIITDDFSEDIMIPLATFETPLWPSTNRGARVTCLAGGISATVISDKMTRSILLEAPDSRCAKIVIDEISRDRESLENIVMSSSRFAKLLNLHFEIVANLIYLRLEFSTGDASGHNMATLAAEKVMNFILEKNDSLNYLSLSANICTDKKVSAINGILGRGKHVIAEVVIPAKLCSRHLKTTPEKVVDLNIKKNLLGSNLAGSIRTGNAHFANILLAFYLATGQDAANIVEGSQGIVHTEIRNNDLYFSVTLPNIIVGSVGNGKELDFVKKNLDQLDCNNPQNIGKNAQRLAIIAACSVLCGELSLLASLTNPGDLMRAHTKLER